MTYQIKFFGRIHPEQAAVSIPGVQMQINSPTPSLNGSTWLIYAHGSQLLITASFNQEEGPPIEKARDVAYRLALTVTNLIGFFALRTYQVEVVAADDAIGNMWVFGADVIGITETSDRVVVDWTILQRLPGVALRCLQSAMDDFRQALTQNERAAMLVHRLLETLAWRYVADDEKASLSAGDWNEFWNRVGLTEAPEREWALTTLQPVATRIRHGRYVAEATSLFQPAIALARIVISRFIASELAAAPPPATGPAEEVAANTPPSN